MWPTFALYPQGKEHGCLLMKKNTLFHVLSGNVHSHGVSLVTHWGNISGKKKLNWLKCRTADPRSQELGISSVTGSHGGVVT